MPQDDAPAAKTPSWAWAVLSVVAGSTVAIAIAYAALPETSGRLVQWVTAWSGENWSAAGTWAGAFFTGAAFVVAFYQLNQQRSALQRSIEAQTRQVELASRQVELMAADLEPMFILSQVELEVFPERDIGPSLAYAYGQVHVRNLGGTAYHVRVDIDGMPHESSMGRYPGGTLDVVPNNSGSDPIISRRIVVVRDPAVIEQMRGGWVPLGQIGREVTFHYLNSRGERRSQTYLWRGVLGPPIKRIIMPLIPLEPTTYPATQPATNGP